MKRIITVLILALLIGVPTVQAQVKTYIYGDIESKNQSDENGKRTIYTVKETGEFLQGICKVIAMNELSYSVVNYIDGKKEGKQELFNKKGEMYLESTFVDGYEHGPAFFYYPNGKIKEKRNLDKGRLTGHFEYFDEKGNLIEEMFLENGAVRGIKRKYLNGDTIFEANYQKGGLVGRSYDATADTILISWHSGPEKGEFEVYYSKDALKLKGKKNRGKKLGEWTYYSPDGILQKVENYKNGEPHGVFRHYYTNGQPAEETSYNEGKIEGTKQSWAEDGKLLQLANYKNGLREGSEIIYYPDGKVKSEYTYVEGMAEGPYKIYNTAGKQTESGRMENNDYVERIFYNEKGKVTDKQRKTEKGWEKF